MHRIFYILVLLLIVACRESNKQEKKIKSFSEVYTYDTIYGYYDFKFIKKRQTIKKQKYESILNICQNVYTERSNSLKYTCDSFGYIIFENNKIYFIRYNYYSIDTIFLNHDNYYDRQILVNFDSKVGEKDTFWASSIFEAPIVLLVKKVYSSEDNDTIYTFINNDILEPGRIYNPSHLYSYSVGKRVGFVSFIYTDFHSKMTCHLPDKIGDWKFW